MEGSAPMPGNAMDCYEDMFKEITRKLYGEEGLPDLVMNERLASSQDRSMIPDYDIESSILKPEEHITAFGLAALMQNGFPPAGILNPPAFQQHKLNLGCDDKWIISEDSLQWTHSKIASYNPTQRLFRCTECDCVGYLPRVAEHWLGTHSNLRIFQCPQCPYESAWARCVRMHLMRQHNVSAEETTEALLKNNPVLQEVTRYLQRLKTRLELNNIKTSPNSQQADEFANTTPSNSRNTTTQQSGVATDAAGNTPSKRYSCSYCPYATDRRDLFTRHENIHREEKPFQCYVCQKQFNRADHVKKHFLRMHREHPYDLNRIRRHPPKNASGMSFYHKYNSSIQTSEPQAGEVSGIPHSLTIPNAFTNIARGSVRPNHNINDTKSVNSQKPIVQTSGKSPTKKKGEKRFVCCYCSWSGVDNWCLKRHMNTHLKPFVCALCDYKAARSERLATHVLKVHNKRICGKCSYVADDLAQLAAHQQQQHPLDQRTNKSSTGTILKNNAFNSAVSATSTTFSSEFSPSQSSLKPYQLSTAAAILQHNNRLFELENKSFKHYVPKQHGAARLFNYMEASDSSEPECDSRSAEEMSSVTFNHRIQSDFPEAGDVGNHRRLFNGPLYACEKRDCALATSPAKSDSAKENVNPEEQAYGGEENFEDEFSRCEDRRKQSQPKKVVANHSDSSTVLQIIS